MAAAMSPFASLDVYQDAVPRSAAMNMAIDEALLKHTSVPILRCYRWRKPSVSFGYFGRYRDVTEHEAEREIVRRWTGGGIVLHGMDFTYSAVIPARSINRIASARVIYEQIHDAIRRALPGHAAVMLAAEDAPKVSHACFANPVVADVLVNGRKIAGAAQRRTRGGLLHQGSIQYEALPPSFAEAFSAALCSKWKPMSLEPRLIDEAHQLADKKYGSEAWLRQR